jgi:hypothetical protein
MGLGSKKINRIPTNIIYKDLRGRLAITFREYVWYCGSYCGYGLKKIIL